MIAIPAYDEILDVTVFRDDVDLSKFYYLPRMPRLLKYPNGKPMFTFMRYQNELRRSDGSDPGGGYLVSPQRSKRTRRRSTGSRTCCISPEGGESHRQGGGAARPRPGGFHGGDGDADHAGERVAGGRD